MVDPARQTRRDQEFFGATVTYAAEDGGEHAVTMVGVDEADFARGQVSWVSPIARTLMKAREGDIVELRAPAVRRAARSAQHPVSRGGGRMQPVNRRLTRYSVE